MKLRPGDVPQWPSSRGLMCSGAQRLAQQRVLAQIDLADRQVVRGAPVAMKLFRALWIEGRHRRESITTGAALVTGADSVTGNRNR